MKNGLKDKKIVIVEDESIIALDLRRTLKFKGYKVASIFNTAEKAIEYCRNNKPDLVLMDIYLSGELDGIEAAEVITSLKIPVIFVTAQQDTEILSKINKSNCCYISKPFDFDRLEEIIHKLFE